MLTLLLLLIKYLYSVRRECVCACVFKERGRSEQLVEACISITIAENAAMLTGQDGI